MNIVVIFHAVNDVIRFEQIILELKKRFIFIDIHQIERYFSGEITLSNCCHLTFDDGDLSFYNNVLPILKKYNLPVTLFVSPLICKDSKNFWFQELHEMEYEEIFNKINHLNIFPAEKVIRNFNDAVFALKCLSFENISKITSSSSNSTSKIQRQYNINVSQLLEILKTGLVEIGAHTLHHPILSNEDEETSSSEITESISLLQSILGKKIKYFAFPNGIPNVDFSGREILTLKNNGISLAFSTEPKCFSSKDSPLSIPRLSISDGSLSFVKLKISLLKYWNYISLVWHPDVTKRKRFIEKLGQTSDFK